MITRYVVTHIGPDGTRRMTQRAWGAYTYATKAEAQALAESIMHHNLEARVAETMGGRAWGSFEARAVECYPVHHDPKSIYFE